MAKQLFPGFRVGPNGEKKLFNSEAEVPEGWTRVQGPQNNEKPAKSAGPSNNALREEYTQVTGKKPGRKQDKTLQDEIDKVKAEWEQFFQDVESTPEEVRNLLSEQGVELPAEDDTGALVALAKEHLVEDDG